MSSTLRASLAGLLAIVVIAASAGCSTGSHNAAPTASRTIDVVMVDHAYEPAQVRVQAGETVRFRFRNTGTVKHEAVIGDDAVHTQHATDMARPTTTEAAHGPDAHGSGGGAVTVDPGATAELTHTFATAGSLVIGCHEPGHWEAGMKAAVTVT